MPAFLKIYTDSAHTNEIGHTSLVAALMSNGSTLAAGASQIPVVNGALFPSSGYLDIDSGANLETITYTGVSGNNLVLTKPTAINHADGIAVVNWFYQLAIGDQTNGILNDGSNFAPDNANTGTWYLYNAGDQTANNIILTTTANVPGTYNGYTDTLISLTSASTGFSTSITPTNMAAGATPVQFWITALVPVGQTIANSANPQVCVITISTNSI